MAAKWTIMVYMAGNNTLSEAADEDLAEMRTVGSTADVQVVVFVAQSRLSGTARRFKVEKDGRGEQVETLNNVDSGAPQTVVDFIRWGLNKAPAEKYAIILWNHGGGWAPSDFSQLYAEVRKARGEAADVALVKREMNVRAAQPIARAFFSTTVKEVMGSPTERQRAICCDDGSGHSLDTIELGRVLKLAKTAIGHKIDLLGMDACLMSTLEVAYEVRGEAAIVVGSEETEPGAGWDYATLLRELAAEPTMDVKQLGQRAVATYIASYEASQNQWPVTLCAVDTAQIEGPCKAVDALERALRPQLGANWSKLLSAHKASVKIEASLQLVDVASLCQNLTTAPLGPSVQDSAQAVLDAIKPGGYVIAAGHLGREVDGCGGVSLYMPGPMEHVSPYYKDLSFAKKHRWDELLKEYHSAV